MDKILYAYRDKTWVQIAIEFQKEPNEATIQHSVWNYDTRKPEIVFSMKMQEIRANAFLSLAEVLPSNSEEALEIRHSLQCRCEPIIINLPPAYKFEHVKALYGRLGDLLPSRRY